MFDFCGGRLVRVYRHYFLHITELLGSLSVLYNVTLIVLLRMRCKRKVAGLTTGHLRS